MAVLQLIVYVLAAFFSAFPVQGNTTPSCYDSNGDVGYKWNSYQDTSGYPASFLYEKRVDWMVLEPGKNCGFYTSSDVYFASYN